MNKSTTFLRIILLPVTLICAFVGLHCSGQDFLQKYPVLKKSDLKPFFEDWKVYSDSIAKIPQNYDPEIARVFMENQPEKSATTRYTVVPEKTYINRYDLNFQELDSITKVLYESFGTSSPELDTDKEYTTDSLKYILPDKGLYLTDLIYKKLSEFVGGLEIAKEKYSEINKNNLAALREYISVERGHWGDYWHFVSFPIILYMTRINDLIVIYTRNSQCTGKEIWYVKQRDEFVRIPEPKGQWIE